MVDKAVGKIKKANTVLEQVLLQRARNMCKSCESVGVLISVQSFKPSTKCRWCYTDCAALCQTASMNRIKICYQFTWFSVSDVCVLNVLHRKPEH